MQAPVHNNSEIKLNEFVEPSPFGEGKTLVLLIKIMRLFLVIFLKIKKSGVKQPLQL